MPQGPETRLLDAARRVRQSKLTLAEQSRLDALLTALERALETPAERQTRLLMEAPPATTAPPVTAPPSHSGQLPAPAPELANTR